MCVDQSDPNAEKEVTMLSKIYLMRIHSHRSNWTSHGMHMCRPTKLLLLTADPYRSLPISRSVPTINLQGRKYT